MDWTDVMTQRDHLLHGLEPLIGRRRARQRANDVIQALVWCQDDPPRDLVLRMLLRDLRQADARAVAAAVLARWAAFRGSPRPARPFEDATPPAPRERRETRMIGRSH